MTENKKTTGSRYEKLVAAFLKKQGINILEMNYRCRIGEIDIIAKDGEYLVFVEVKFRNSKAAGSSLEAIDHKKAFRIRNAARVYLYTHGYPEDTPCRFDAAGIDKDALRYIKDAF